MPWQGVSAHGPNSFHIPGIRYGQGIVGSTYRRSVSFAISFHASRLQCSTYGSGRGLAEKWESCC